jgi:hypothetical protein
MDGTVYSPNNMVNEITEDIEQNMDATYLALVDAIIPRSPNLAELYGRIQYYGALDLDTAYYIIMTLNYYFLPLAIPIAELLNEAAKEYVYLSDNLVLLNNSLALKNEYFAALTPEDRFETLNLVEQLKDTDEFILSITSSLNRFTMIGYYSEWFGYGTTKFAPPNDRILEFYPLSWEQVGYPGPSLGYPALRLFNYLPTQ